MTLPPSCSYSHCNLCINAPSLRRNEVFCCSMCSAGAGNVTLSKTSFRRLFKASKTVFLYGSGRQMVRHLCAHSQAPPPSVDIVPRRPTKRSSVVYNRWTTDSAMLGAWDLPSRIIHSPAVLASAPFSFNMFAVGDGHSGSIGLFDGKPGAPTPSWGSGDGSFFYTGHTGISSMLWDDRHLVTGGVEGSIRFSDDGVEAGLLCGHQGRVNALCGIGDVLISGSDTAEVFIWDKRAKSHVKTVHGHLSSLKGLCSVPALGSFFFLSAGAEGVVKLFDMRKVDNALACVHAFPQPGLCDMDSSNTTVAVVNSEGSSVLFDLSFLYSASDSILPSHHTAVLAPHWNGTCVSISQCGSYVGIGLGDGTVQILSDQGKPLSRRLCHIAPVAAIDWTPDLVLSASRDHTVAATGLWRGSARGTLSNPVPLTEGLVAAMLVNMSRGLDDACSKGKPIEKELIPPSRHVLRVRDAVYAPIGTNFSHGSVVGKNDDLGAVDVLLRGGRQVLLPEARCQLDGRFACSIGCKRSHTIDEVIAYSTGLGDRYIIEEDEEDEEEEPLWIEADSPTRRRRRSAAQQSELIRRISWYELDELDRALVQEKRMAPVGQRRQSEKRRRE